MNRSIGRRGVNRFFERRAHHRCRTSRLERCERPWAQGLGARGPRSRRSAWQLWSCPTRRRDRRSPTLRSGMRGGAYPRVPSPYAQGHSTRVLATSAPLSRVSSILHELAEALAGRDADRFAGEHFVERLGEVADLGLRGILQVVVEAAAVEDAPLLVAEERLAGALRAEPLRERAPRVVQEGAAEPLLLVELALVGRRLVPVGKEEDEVDPLAAVGVDQRGEPLGAVGRRRAGRAGEEVDRR